MGEAWLLVMLISILRTLISIGIKLLNRLVLCQYIVLGQSFIIVKRTSMGHHSQKIMLHLKEELLFLTTGYLTQEMSYMKGTLLRMKTHLGHTPCILN